MSVGDNSCEEVLKLRPSETPPSLVYPILGWNWLMQRFQIPIMIGHEAVLNQMPITGWSYAIFSKSNFGIQGISSSKQRLPSVFFGVYTLAVIDPWWILL